MNEAKVKVFLLTRAHQMGLPATVYPPSAFLSSLGGFTSAWSQVLSEATASIQAGVWSGGALPHGYPAPNGAEPGAAYWIMLPNGSMIFQYGDSPYAPETPGLAPGRLTTENVEVAMQAHVQALAEETALERLAQRYLEWVAEQL
jgi:hypothetical protein